MHWIDIEKAWLASTAGLAGVLAILATVTGEQLLGTAAIISAFAGLVVAAGGFMLQLRTYREVKTINSKSLANLADETEDRRVAEIPAAEQTLENREHIVAVEKAAAKKEGK